MVMFAIKSKKSKKIWNIVYFYKTLSLSIVYSMCDHEYRKIIDLITNIEEYQKIYNHVWKDISQKM